LEVPRQLAMASGELDRASLTEQEDRIA